MDHSLAFGIAAAGQARRRIEPRIRIGVVQHLLQPLCRLIAANHAQRISRDRPQLRVRPIQRRLAVLRRRWWWPGVISHTRRVQNRLHRFLIASNHLRPAVVGQRRNRLQRAEPHLHFHGVILLLRRLQEHWQAVQHGK